MLLPGLNFGPTYQQQEEIVTLLKVLIGHIKDLTEAVKTNAPAAKKAASKKRGTAK